MIKINLLPAYIVERRAVRRLMQTFVVLAVLLVFGIVGVAYGVYQRGTARVNQDLAQNWQAGSDRAQTLKREIGTLQTDQETRLNIFLDFYDQVKKHNAEFARVLETINRYIYKAVAVEEMTLENDQFTLKGRIDSNENLAKFYENIRRCPALVPDSVKIEKVPVYPIKLEGGAGETTGTVPPRPSEFSLGGQLPSGESFNPETGIITRRIPRPEYDFTMTARLMPGSALAPPSSPLGAAPDTGGYTPGTGAYPSAPTGSGTPARPSGSSGGVSGISGRRGQVEAAAQD